MTHATISSFSGQYRFLSNFYQCSVPYAGLIYPSSEHAYVAAKTLDLALREAIRDISAPAAVKKYGRILPLRPNWDNLKFGIMYDIVMSKFTTEPLRSMLIATGGAELIEGNTWGDRYWGVCRGVGENRLGQLLMRVRDRLKEDEGRS